MTAPYEPTAADPPDRLRKASQDGASPLPTGHDTAYGNTAAAGSTAAYGNTAAFGNTAAAGNTAGYPSTPVQYPGASGHLEPAGQPTGASYDPAVYQPPPYGQPPYAAAGFPAPYPPFGAAPRNGMGTAGLVLGIIGVVFCWSPLGVVLGILAIIFGGVGLGRAKRGEATNRGAAMAGLVLGIVAVALLVLLLAVGLSVGGSTFTR